MEASFRRSFAGNFSRHLTVLSLSCALPVPARTFPKDSAYEPLFHRAIEDQSFSRNPVCTCARSLASHGTRRNSAGSRFAGRSETVSTSGWRRRPRQPRCRHRFPHAQNGRRARRRTIDRRNPFPYASPQWSERRCRNGAALPAGCDSAYSSESEGPVSDQRQCRVATAFPSVARPCRRVLFCSKFTSLQQEALAIFPFPPALSPHLPQAGGWPRSW